MHGQLVARTYRRRRREQKFGVFANLPPGYELLVFEVFGRACVACGGTHLIGLDHHWPLRWGRSLLHNAVPLCRSCNRRKGNKDPREFYDAWKHAEILLGLHAVRELYEQRFGAACAAATEAA